ncbi:MAG: hypothetical protein AAB592_00845 [Patescibacteria group bacterium]
MLISDKQLYKLCQRYGSRALKWRRKFIGLLPEVYRRHIYKRRGFSSIFEFAAKLSGISEEQVRRVLNLEKRFFDKPALHSLLVSGQASVNKLARVAGVATVENEEDWAGRVIYLSKTAIDALVKDHKFEDQNGLNKPIFNGESVPGHINSQQNNAVVNDDSDVLSLKLSGDTMARLRGLQRRGIDVDVLINEFLDRREEEIEKEKSKIAQKQDNSNSNRYIPTKIKNVVYAEYGNKCAIPNCARASEAIHHTNRFALARNHNPYFLAPLCRAHHEIAHSIDQKVFENKGPPKNSS